MSVANLTEGTISIDKLSVNTNLGFSIVSYNGNQVSNATVAHGLGVKPELIIVKNLESAVSWGVWTTGISDSQVLRLDQTAAATTPATAYFEPQNNTSKFFSLGTNDETNHNDDYIAYCFASKRGVSKVGSYIGTGAAGNKVYTGFEPAFVMLKLYSNANSSGHWIMFDNARGAEPPMLRGNTADSEFTGDRIDFNADGFTLKDSDAGRNYNNYRYIYYAVAKNTNETELHDTDLELHLDADSFPEKGESGYSNTPSTWTALTGSNGTITGATFDSELGNWLDFDGNGDVVTTTYDAPTGAKTLEVWFNAASSYNATYQGVLGGDNEILWIGGNLTSAYTNESILWYQNPSELGLAIRDGEDKYLDNKWHHLVIVDTGSAHKMYLDGEEKSFTYQYGSASVRFDWDNLVLGRGYRTNGTDDFTGKIGQVRAYDSALTQDEVRQNFNFTKNDYPNGYNGTLNSMSGSNWNSNGYFNFTTDDYIDLTGNAPYSSSTTQTDTVKCVTGWIKPDTSTSRVHLYSVSSTSSSNDFLQMGWFNDLSLFRVNVRNGTTSQKSIKDVSITPTTNWVHVVVQVTETTTEIYLDGDPQTVTFSNAGSGTNTSWISFVSYASGVKHSIGRSRAVSPNWSDGNISKVKHYDRTLTQAEITALYNEGE